MALASDRYELKSHRGDFLLDIKSVGITAPPFTNLVEADQIKPVLRVSLDLANLSANRKIDAVGKFLFKLTDEFGNQYHQLNGLPDEGLSGDQGGQSLYPQGSITKDVLFETPIEQCKTLRLDVSVAGVTDNNPFRFEIPADAVRGFTAEEAKNNIDDKNLTIVFPPEGGLVRAGEEVLVRVQLTSGINLPDTVFVMSPNCTFEDVHRVLQYNVHIPVDQAPGAFPIIVLAKWGKNQATTVISKTVTLRVLGTAEETAIK